MTDPVKPLRWSATYDGRPDTSGAARDFTAAFLAHAESVGRIQRTDRMVASVQLVVSELVTNAGKYAPGPCLVDLEVVDDLVRVTVWDTEPTLPTPEERDPERVGGHGWEIVLGLCRRVRVQRLAGGKRIRADIGP